jgi:hydroxymethylpyrimidine/phosphomethylpyrimidine kinase
MLASPLAERPAVVLCIAGFDPSGGAGLLADARACAAMQAHAVCVQTALVPQNTRGVHSIAAVTPELVLLQARTLLDDIPVSAIKVGLIPNLAVLDAIVEIVTPLIKKKGIPLVVDPVLAPSNGPAFTDDTEAQAILDRLFPLATLVTPNTIEAARLSAYPIESVKEMEGAARARWERTQACAVLVKGGHVAPVEAKRSVDQRSGGEKNPGLLVQDVFFDGKNLRELRSPYVEGAEVRGTGCMLASAIAAQLAHGVAPFDAARLAKNWLTKRIETAHSVGQGRRIAAY